MTALIITTYPPTSDPIRHLRDSMRSRLPPGQFFRVGLTRKAACFPGPWSSSFNESWADPSPACPHEEYLAALDRCSEVRSEVWRPEASRFPEVAGLVEAGQGGRGGLSHSSRRDTWAQVRRSLKTQAQEALEAVEGPLS